MTVEGARELQPARPQPPPPWPAVIEVVASLVAVGATALVFLNYFGARFTMFDAPARIDDQQVRTYWVLVATLLVSVLASFTAAAWRHARRAFAWHALVGVVGVWVALSFPVTQVGLVQDRPEPAPAEPSDRQGNPVCRSGGDSDECVGG